MDAIDERGVVEQGAARIKDDIGDRPAYIQDIRRISPGCSMRGLWRKRDRRASHTNFRAPKTARNRRVTP